jgi:hypothetical protein
MEWKQIPDNATLPVITAARSAMDQTAAVLADGLLFKVELVPARDSRDLAKHLGLIVKD